MAALDIVSDAIPSVHAGSLEIRLANGAHEIDAAQALRYRIFYEEMSASPTPEMRRLRRDFDRFDSTWDHLVVIDHGNDVPGGSIVATYRIHFCDASTPRENFYTLDEYDLGPIFAHRGPFLELGRMCVDADYRSGATLQLLWRGVAEYVLHHDIQLMFGCASLSGTDPVALALPLSYLHQQYLAPESIRPRALPDKYIPMDRIPAGHYSVRDARRALPPLFRGYLRLGGFVGDGAVIDPQFDTVDVCMVVKTELVTERYHAHYLREVGAHGTHGMV